MLKTKEGIKDWLYAYGIENYTINENLTVDVNGDVDLFNRNLKMLPIQFGTVDGYFNCARNELKSLVNAPQKVSSHFNCSSNKLITLNDCPKFVGGNFACRDNPITDISKFDCNFSGDFIHSGSPISRYEAFYEVTKGNSGKELFPL